ILVLTSCKPVLLPMSSVMNSKQNIKVMDFMDKYKSAIEKCSVEDVMALVSPDFYESNREKNNPTGFGAAQLKVKLQKVFSHVKSVTLRYHVQKIDYSNDLVNVYYYFNEHVLADFPVGEEWMSGNDVNRLILREKRDVSGESYEILSGL
ncbi:MAG: hypothetical protein O2897_02920, partial [bacterium]|nr:hypothetical protein [bacterium]